MKKTYKLLLLLLATLGFSLNCSAAETKCEGKTYYYFYSNSIDDYVLCPGGLVSSIYECDTDSKPGGDKDKIVDTAYFDEFCSIQLTPGHLLSSHIDFAGQGVTFELVPCSKGNYCIADTTLNIFPETGDTSTYEEYHINNLKYESSGYVEANEDIGMYNCPTGWREGVGISKLDDCEKHVAPGKYWDGSLVKDCPEGSYCSGTVITYEDRNIAAGKTSCPADKPNSSAGSTSSSACTSPSGGGGTTGGGEESTDKCTSGWQDGGPQTDLNNCKKDIPAGKYWDGSALVTCPAGKYCPEGSILYKNRENDSTNVKACPGKFVNGGTGLTSIGNCAITIPKGYHYKAALQDKLICPAGDYCSGVTVKYDRYGTTTGNTDCPGKFVDGGTGLTSIGNCAIIIPEGYHYKAALQDKLICPEGSYCPGVTVKYDRYGTTTGITACPKGMTSAKGSTKESDCKVESHGIKSISVNGVTSKFAGSEHTYEVNLTQDATKTTIKVELMNSNSTAKINDNSTTSCTNGVCTLTINSIEGGKYSISITEADNFKNDPYYIIVNKYEINCPSLFNVSSTAKQITDCKIVLKAGEYYNATDKKIKTCDKDSYCEGGTLNYTDGNVGIKSCPKGMTTSSTGKTKESDCTITANPGYYITVEDGGKYVSVNCISKYYCPGGTFTKDTALLGSYKICPTGTTSAAGAKSKTDCYVELKSGQMFSVSNNVYKAVECSADHYCLGGNIKINDSTYGATKCDAGYSTNGKTGSKTKDACTKIENYKPLSCNAGTEEVGGKCVACSNKDGVNSYGSACIISTCKEGYTKTDNVCLKNEEETKPTNTDPKEENKEDTPKTEEKKENPKTGIIISGISVITLLAGGCFLYMYSNKNKLFNR